MSDTSDEQIQKFLEAFERAFVASGKTQAELARETGYGNAAVSQWRSGMNEPKPPAVFAIERALGLNPGDLSQYLGYVPAGADRSAVDVEAALAVDPTIDDDSRRGLLLLYRQSRRTLELLRRFGPGGASA